MSEVIGNVTVYIDANGKLAVKEFKKVDDASRKFSRNASRNFKSAAKSFSAFRIAAAGAVAALATREIAQAGIAMQGLQRAFSAAAGSAKEGANEFRFVREQADRLGLDLETSARAYAKLTAAAEGTALEGQAARDIFRSVAEASRVMSLSTEQTEGALTALEQIISKGKVSAEELRGQLGERLPGAFQIAARSIGVTTAELDDMLKKGELTAEQLLPNLARELSNTFGSGVAAATTDAQAAFARLENALFELKAAIADSGLLNLISQLAEKTAELLQSSNSLFARFGLAKADRFTEYDEAISGSVERIGELKAELAEADSLFDKFFGAKDRDGLKQQLDAEKQRLVDLKKARADLEAFYERADAPAVPTVQPTAPAGQSSAGGTAEPTPEPLSNAVFEARLRERGILAVQAAQDIADDEAAIYQQLLDAEVNARAITDQQLVEMAAESARLEVEAELLAKQAARGDVGAPLSAEEELQYQEDVAERTVQIAEDLANKRRSIEQELSRDLRQINQQTLNQSVQLFGALYDAYVSFAGESKAIGVALFLAQKAAAVSSIVVQFEVAKAMVAAQTGIGAPPLIAALEAQRALSLATVAASSVAEGASQFGGGSSGGLNFSGGGSFGTAPAISNSGSSVISNIPDSRTISEAPVVNVYGSNSDGADVQLSRDENGRQVIDVFLEAAATDIQKGGVLSRSIQTSFGVNTAVRNRS